MNNRKVMKCLKYSKCCTATLTSICLKWEVAGGKSRSIIHKMRPATQDHAGFLEQTLEVEAGFRLGSLEAHSAAILVLCL